MVVEGEEVQASVTVPSKTNSEQVFIEAIKKDGSLVLNGTASVGEEQPKSELENRLARLRPPEKLVILSELQEGDKGKEPEQVNMGFDQHLGDMYPFTLNEKLEKITELCNWHSQEKGADSPWGRPVIPFEMVSVLNYCTVEQAGWKVKNPHVRLFADLEVRMLNGPVFADEPYILEREIIALSESRRTESLWTRTIIRSEQTGADVAAVILNVAHVKESYPDYEKELKESV